LVTGGSSGLGEACVILLVSKGANVVILDINSSINLSKMDPQKTLFLQTDVTSEESVKNAIDITIKKFTEINGLINCAGVGAAQRTTSSKGHPHDLELFSKVIQINLIGTFNVSRLVASQMIKQKADSEGHRGVIINTASVAAYEGQVGQVAYAASKAGVVGMTLVMSRDLSIGGIRVNTISPGLFYTPMLSKLPSEHINKMQNSVQFPKRLGKPDEFAHLVLCIIENPYLNGETIRLDGAVRLAAL